MDEPINETPQTEEVEALETDGAYEIEATPGEEEDEIEIPSRAELAAQAYQAITDAALQSDFTRAERKAATRKRKSAHASRMKNKGKKRKNRNRSGVIYR